MSTGTSPNLSSLPLGALLDQVGAKTPIPGGGSIVPVIGALGASLGTMAVNYSLGRPDLAAHQPALSAAFSTLERSRALLAELAQEDMRAYIALNAAMKLPRGDPRRAAELPALADAAAQVPLTVMATCGDLLRLFESIAAMVNRHLLSDLAIAAILAEAAARASRWNVAINAPLMDPRAGAERLALADVMLRAAVGRLEAIENACRNTG